MIFIKKYLIILSLIFISGCIPSIKFSSDLPKDKDVAVAGTDTLVTDTDTDDIDIEIDIEPEIKGTGKTYQGKCSYYASKFNGRKTASGVRFDNSKFTAAHRSLPFGTKVKVTNLRNQKYCVVEINDRGPWKGGRIIDVSQAAAEALDMKRAGVVDVEIEILE